MNLSIVDKVYFIGIGGIGMSALARYFKSQGKRVGGYDKVETTLTKSLIKEGIEVQYHTTTTPEWILSDIKETVLVVYTPAIPETNQQLIDFRKNGYNLFKRAEVLGFITQNAFTIAIAGTHGKTTTATLLAHVLRSAGMDCTAFLGGISNNYNTNLLIAEKGNIVVVEADEYDRSFLHLKPDIAVITSVDNDHMDIYSDTADLQTTFQDFARKVKPNGTLIVNKSIDIAFDIPENGSFYTYSSELKADYRAFNLQIIEGKQYFDAQIIDVLPGEIHEQNTTGIAIKLPGRHNVENAVASIAVACQLGLECSKILQSISSFKGVKRRFDTHIEGKHIYIDDYAHHPEELNATLQAVSTLYPKRFTTIVFQPHLYSRTRDFADDFAKALSGVDELILLEIYPAREKPIQGVTAEMLLKKIQSASKSVKTKEALLEDLKNKKRELLLTLGAGDIDQLVEPIKALYHR